MDQFAEIGGGQMCMLDMLPPFLDRGWQVHAVIPSPGAYATRLLAAGASVDFFRGSQRIRYPADLLYVNGPRVLPSAVLAASRAPVLFHAHHHITKKIAQVIASLCVRARSATVISCSRSVARQYRNTTVVPNGVPDHGYRERFAGQMVKPRIGIIGRITPDKGHLLFLQAARLLTDGRFGCRFVICGIPGEGDNEYAGAVLEASRALPVEWLGWRVDIAQVLQELDILVLASTMEGLPRVMLEAFSAGVPVIAFAAGGIPEAIRDGDTGFLVEERSPAALGDKIESLLGSGGALERVSRNARRAWEATYNVERYRGGVMDVVDQLIRQ